MMQGADPEVVYNKFGAGGNALNGGGTPQYDLLWTTRGVNGANQLRFATWPSAQTLATSSFYVLCKWNGPSGQTFAAYSSMLGDTNISNWEFMLLASYNAPDLYPRFVPAHEADSAIAYGGNLNDGAWHVVAGVCDGATARIYVDGVELGAKAHTGALTLAGLILSGHNGGSPMAGWIPWPGEMGYVLPYSVGHTAAEVGAVTRWLMGVARRRGIAIDQPNSFFVIEGDSFSEWANGLAYNLKWGYKAARAMATVVQHRNYALSGRRLDQMLTLGPTTSFLLANAAKKNNIFVFWGGPNDAGSSAETIWQRNHDLAVAARAAGFSKVVTLNMLPKALGAGGAPDTGYNAKRDAVNALLAADHSFVDVLIDVAADAVMGNVATTADVNYYYDGWHPAAAGHTIIAGYVTTVLDALVAA